ncbi:MAG: IclR family transcriptional regulator [Janthinobacterium lividum]
MPSFPLDAGRAGQANPAPSAASELTPGAAVRPRIDPRIDPGLDPGPGLEGASAPPAADRPSDSYVQSFARGLSVIRSFSAERPAQTLTDVAGATGLTRAGARRILLTLHTLGYVAMDGRFFRLTPRILELGFAYLTSLPFWNLAQPVLETLVTQLRESSSAAVLDGTDIVYVLRIPVQKIMTINLSIGSRLPAYCSSMGRVLLAGLSENELDTRLAASTLVARTPHTLTDRQALKTEIAKVRLQGWAIVDQELEAGLISLSAPIRDRQGRVIAAMNISGNAQRNDAAQMTAQFLEPLRAAAHHVSSLVAGRG